MIIGGIIMLKSLISSHTATREEVLSRAQDVIACGTPIFRTTVEHTTITEISLGNNMYVITMVKSEIASLELVGVYCFAL